MWLTLNDASKYLKVSKETLYKFAQNEEIPCAKIGSQWRFNKTEIDNWMATSNSEKDLVDDSPLKATSIKNEPGWVHLDFFPRNSLKEFTDDYKNISILKWDGGKKGSRNMCIFGENLASLAALKTGFGVIDKQVSVDIIYIDPPYNVGGNQGYKNTWKGKSEKERDWAGDHGAFLDFMEPRLKIGYSLLSDDGIIFISICDREFSYLKILMNQIFGEANEIATFIWNKRQGASSAHVVDTHEYVICYAKNKAKAPILSQQKPSAQMIIEQANKVMKNNSFEEAQQKFKKWVSEQKKAELLKGGESQYFMLHPVSKRVFRIDNSCAHDDPNGRRCRTQLKHPVTKKLCPVPKNGWKWKEETLLKMVEEGRIFFGKDETTIPCVIKYLDELMTEQPQTVIDMPSSGKFDLPEGIDFTTPKPIALIKKLISLYPKNDAVILDYFAGSGTTAVATDHQNREDGGKRSWILIEEMGSTFNKVLLPRIKLLDEKKDFSIFNLQTSEINDSQLLKIFQKYSFEFFSAYHNLDENDSIIVEGMHIVGVEKKNSTVVAMTVPPARRNENFINKELKALKDFNAMLNIVDRNNIFKMRHYFAFSLRKYLSIMRYPNKYWLLLIF